MRRIELSYDDYVEVINGNLVNFKSKKEYNVFEKIIINAPFIETKVYEIRHKQLVVSSKHNAWNYTYEVRLAPIQERLDEQVGLGLSSYDYVENNNIYELTLEAAKRAFGLPPYKETNNLQVFFNDKKKATTLKSGDKVVVVKCKKGEKYSRRIGFLEAYFQLKSELSKNKAHEYLEKVVKK